MRCNNGLGNDSQAPRRKQQQPACEPRRAADETLDVQHSIIGKTTASRILHEGMMNVNAC